MIPVDRLSMTDQSAPTMAGESSIGIINSKRIVPAQRSPCNSRASVVPSTSSTTIVGTATSAVTQILDQKAPLWMTWSYSVKPGEDRPPHERRPVQAQPTGIKQGHNDDPHGHDRRRGPPGRSPCAAPGGRGCSTVSSWTGS